MKHQMHIGLFRNRGKKKKKQEGSPEAQLQVPFSKIILKTCILTFKILHTLYSTLTHPFFSMKQNDWTVFFYQVQELRYHIDSRA